MMQFGWTPLMYAAWHGHDAICTLLTRRKDQPFTFSEGIRINCGLEAGLKLNAAKHLPSRRDKYLEVCRLLGKLKKGSDSAGTLGHRLSQLALIVGGMITRL